MLSDAALMLGKNQRRIGSMTRLVCSEEKESVEATKIIAAHSSAGHHARSQSGNSERGGMREPSPASFLVRDADCARIRKSTKVAPL